MICYLFTEPLYFFYSPDAPTLLYYAYVPTAIIALFAGFYVFWNGRKFLLNKLLFAISISFLLWAISIIIEWTNIHSEFILFVWNFQGIIFSLIAILCVYFIYVFLNKKDVSTKLKFIFLTLFAPIFFLTPNLYLSGFNLTTCDAFNFEWEPFKIYYTLLGVSAIFWILILLISSYRKEKSNFRKQIVLMGTGIEFFLFLFFIWTSLTYYLTENGILPDSSLEMYGMLGVVIFMIYISILMVQFKTFNIKLIATQALVWGLVILIGSQFFFIKTPTNMILNGFTFVSSIIFGFFLVRSVKNEIRQKDKLLELTINLRTLLKQRESLVHLVTHKVKGSFTRTKFIFAGILDGTFGQISPEIKKVAEQGLDFDNGGIQTVDLVLNVANMQNGIIKYDMKQIDFKDIVLQATNDKKLGIENKGLKLETNIGDGIYNTTGDAFWLKEVVNNLIENSIKYTKEGKILVGLENTEKDGINKILLSVKDSGIGITEEDKKNLFTEGGRGKDSVKVNVDSTGYGLYTVKLIVDAHKGTVSAESEGPGKGSQFYVELPTA